MQKIKKGKNKNSPTSANKIKFRLDSMFFAQLCPVQQHRLHNCALHTAQAA